MMQLMRLHIPVMPAEFVQMHSRRQTADCMWTEHSVAVAIPSFCSKSADCTVVAIDRDPDAVRRGSTISSNAGPAS